MTRHSFSRLLSHMSGALIVCLIIVCVVTPLIFEAHSQLNSASDGIEILLVDSSLSLGDPDKLASEIKKITGTKYAGVATLASSEAENYIRTIDNYPMEEYLKYLTASRDSELMIVPETMLETVFKMDNIVPVGFSADFTEKSYINGIPYALPLKNITVTDYGAEIMCVQSEPYAVLIGGDHLDTVRAYLSQLTSKTEDQNV